MKIHQINEDEYEGLEDADEFGEPGPPPMANELSPEQLKVLLSGKITSVEAISEPWMDDHEYCVAIRVNGVIDFSIWWCGWEFLAAVKYWFDSRKAREEATSTIRQEARDAAEEIAEEERLG